MNRTGFDLDVVGERLLDQAYRLLGALPLFALALLVIWLGWLFGRWLSKRRVIERIASRNPFLRDLTRTTTRWIVTGAALVIALEILDATALVGAVLGTAGVAGIAIGFAFKDTLENYLAGILMSLRQPFAQRDHVVIDGNEGVVMSMTSRATILMTLDGNHLRLPNALVFRSVTLNYTRNPSRRFEFEVGIGVGEDLVRAQRIGTDRLARLDGVMTKPPPRAYITALGDSNVTVRFHGWVDQRMHDFRAVKSEAIRTVKLALDAAGMDMPEPIYRVHLLQDSQAPAAATTPAKHAAAEEAEAEPVDTSAVDDLHEQIVEDPVSHAANDLLDPAAPKE